jgi:hypothetical protein
MAKHGRALIIVLCLALPATASASHRYAEHQRDRYMTVANCVPTSSPYYAPMRRWISSAAYQWSKAVNFEVRVVACKTRWPGLPLNQPEVKVYAGYYGRTRLEGISTWSYNNRHMYNGVVKINLSYPNAEYRAAVTAHELGHQAGLKHSNERGSTMNQPPWSSFPAPHDYAMIKSIYAHSR